MRDIERIDIVLDELRKYWTANPDLRLGQIIGNAATRAWHNDVRNIEDDVLLNHLGMQTDTKFDFSPEGMRALKRERFKETNPDFSSAPDEWIDKAIS